MFALSAMSASAKKSYWQTSLTFLLFFASWGIWWSFFQIWLTDPNGLNFDGKHVGTVYSANSLAALILMFVYGALQDRLGIRRHVAIFASVLMTLVGPFLIFVYQPLLTNAFMLGVVVGAIFLSAGFISTCALFEALGERLSRRFGFEYGQARMWGSFGYAIVALIAGFTFTRNPHLNFWLGSLFGLACLLVLIFCKDPQVSSQDDDTTEQSDSENSMPGLKDMLALLHMKALWVFIIFVLFSWTFYTVFDQQMFPDFYSSLFATQDQGRQVYGVLNSIQVFVEAAMMGVVPLIMARLGVRKTLLLGITVMFLRIGGCALVDGPVLVSAVKMLHALEVPLAILPIMRYFTLHFDPKLSATLYMVGFQIAAQVGNIVFSTPLGMLRDHIGYRPTFYVIAVCVLAAGIFGSLILKKDNEHVLGDPLVPNERKSRVA
ncbi:MAG: MFS transporter [Corynebacterium sp.]|nr:MFS transporter [Corynebacterium sp.]